MRKTRPCYDQNKKKYASKRNLKLWTLCNKIQASDVLVVMVVVMMVIMMVVVVMPVGVVVVLVVVRTTTQIYKTTKTITTINTLLTSTIHTFTITTTSNATTTKQVLPSQQQPPQTSLHLYSYSVNIFYTCVYFFNPDMRKVVLGSSSTIWTILRVPHEFLQKTKDIMSLPAYQKSIVTVWAS